MERIIIPLILVIIITSCKTEIKKEESSRKKEKIALLQFESPKINPELIDSFFSNEYIDSLILVDGIEILEKIEVNENYDTIKVNFLQMLNWNDPGDFMKIQIRNSKDSLLLELFNNGGWMRCVDYYELPESVILLNQIESDKGLLIKNKTGKQLVLFGYTYASQPGLMTIIDLFPVPRIIFNKKFELKSVTEPNKNGYLNYISGTTLSNEVILNMELMKIEQ